MVVTFLVTANTFGAEAPESKEERAEQRSEVPTTPPQKIVLREIKKGMPLLGEGVGITTMKPVPNKTQPWASRETVPLIRMVPPSRMYDPE